MKLKLKSVKTLIPGQLYWQITFNGNTTNYESYAGAYEAGKKIFKRFYKESAAFAMLDTLSVNLLTLEEGEFVKKLRMTKCKGIKPKQYGWLKGIHERQKREW